MRDPNPGIVIEVIDVIVSSGLVEQARSLLGDALRHGEGSVRKKAVEAMGLDYGQPVREMFLPLLKDPDPQVRRAVLKRFLLAQDASIGTYLANIVKSGEIFAMDEDEQREVFEAMGPNL